MAVATKFPRQRINQKGIIQILKLVMAVKGKRKRTKRQNQDPETIISQYGLSRSCFKQAVDKNAKTPD